MNAFRYDNPKLHGRCIAFSFYGSVLLKRLFKENKMNCKVQVKRYIINKDDDDYSPYHYYIEIKTPTGKTIIDNCSSYNYWFYMDRFKPKGTIEKIGERIIKKDFEEQALDVKEIIKSTILCHFEDIKKCYKF